MKLVKILIQLEYDLHHLLWCIRYPRLFATYHFYIGRGGRLDIGPEARLHFGRGIYLRANFNGDFYGKVTIGDGVFFNRNCYVAVHGELVIGNNSIFGEGVSIHDENHVIGCSSDPIDERGFVIKPVIIGSNVWVGAKATILPGVHIGDNAVVGANSAVTHDVPACTVVGGVPARVIRELKPSPQPVAQ